MKIPKLTAKLNDGEGDLIIDPDWNALPPLLRADILKDWIHLLDEEYVKARSEMSNDNQNLSQKRFSMLRNEDYRFKL